jgi:hypothetical protein
MCCGKAPRYRGWRGVGDRHDSQRAGLTCWREIIFGITELRRLPERLRCLTPKIKYLNHASHRM